MRRFLRGRVSYCSFTCETSSGRGEGSGLLTYHVDRIHVFKVQTGSRQPGGGEILSGYWLHKYYVTRKVEGTRKNQPA